MPNLMDAAGAPSLSPVLFVILGLLPFPLPLPLPVLAFFPEERTGPSIYWDSKPTGLQQASLAHPSSLGLPCFHIYSQLNRSWSGLS